MPEQITRAGKSYRALWVGIERPGSTLPCGRAGAQTPRTSGEGETLACVRYTKDVTITPPRRGDWVNCYRLSLRRAIR